MNFRGQQRSSLWETWENVWLLWSKGNQANFVFEKCKCSPCFDCLQVFLQTLLLKHTTLLEHLSCGALVERSKGYCEGDSKQDKANGRSLGVIWNRVPWTKKNRIWHYTFLKDGWMLVKRVAVAYRETEIRASEKFGLNKQKSHFNNLLHWRLELLVLFKKVPCLQLSWEQLHLKNDQTDLFGTGTTCNLWRMAIALCTRLMTSLTDFNTKLSPAEETKLIWQQHKCNLIKKVSHQNRWLTPVSEMWSKSDSLKSDSSCWVLNLSESWKSKLAMWDWDNLPLKKVFFW